MKLQSLKRKDEFAQIRQRGRKFYGKLSRISMIKTNDGEFKLGIVVSKKVSNKAVDRNKIRRRIKDIARFEAGNLEGGAWVVVVVSRDALGVCYDEFKREIQKGFEKLFRTGK